MATRASNRGEVDAMRAVLFATERSHGRFEGQGVALPDALRRGAAGDVAAAEEVAALLDDVNPEYRREAARVLFDLRSPKVTAQLARTSAHDEDAEVTGISKAALLRIDAGTPSAPVRALLDAPAIGVRRRAALALAERDDGVGTSELIGWLKAPDVEFSRQREILAALGHVKARAAVPELVGLLDDVRLRGLVATALGAIGDAAARAPLLAHLENEAYVGVREKEARALLALGAARDLRTPLTRYAGLPEPTPNILAVAVDAGLIKAEAPAQDVRVSLRAPNDGPLRLGILLGEGTGDWTLEIDGHAVNALASSANERWAFVAQHGDVVSVHAAGTPGIRGLWLVAGSK